MSNKIYHLDDAPDIMSKLMAVIDDEVDRILSIPPDERDRSDIRLALSCLDKLTTLHKDNRQDSQLITMQIRPLPQAKLRSLLAKSDISASIPANATVIQTAANEKVG